MVVSKLLGFLLNHSRDPYPRSLMGNTPCRLALEENHLQIVQLLSERTGEEM